ncbi:rhodanese-like domain-containing protein [Nocardia sp. R7R-8]|uniref:rhodanese-like domain-containing protein n=1 Tax=Nocardia sp. R7R-8 TaxID=3459304 RepID=UPI00403E0F95
MPSRADTLITATELARWIDAAEPVTILDIRWQLGRTDGPSAYADGHIPGAVYVDLETELSDHTVPGRGRHPLPAGSAVQAAARRWGARTGVPIVVYDDWNRAGSARAWWVLRAAGIPGVRILDGGLGAWVAEGHRLDTGVEQPHSGDIEVTHDDLYSGALPAFTAEEASAATSRGILIDARAPERFSGETEPIDPVAGHIPGARNVPSAAALDGNGLFRPATELAALFEAAGVRGAGDIGAYCGSGVTAAVQIVALRIIGIDAALFPGSWSQWSADPSRPVATGDTPTPGQPVRTPFPG